MIYPNSGGSMIVKKRLIIRGNVQEMGFRFFRKKLASRFKIKSGSVKNLEDENEVEIYCECEQEKFEKFKIILRKLRYTPEEELRPTDITKIEIEDIQEFDEKSEGFNLEDIKTPFEVFYKDKKDKESEKFEVGCLTIKNM